MNPADFSKKFLPEDVFGDYGTKNRESTLLFWGSFVGTIAVTAMVIIGAEKTEPTNREMPENKHNISRIDQPPKQDEDLEISNDR